MNIRDLKCVLGYQRIMKVDEKVLRGSAAFTPIKVARLKLKGVNQIIDLRATTIKGAKTAKAIEKFYCKCFNIKYISMPVAFMENFLPDENLFKNAIARIKENKFKTYVHCHFGKHRTGECIAYYQKQKKYDDASIIKELLENGWNHKADFEEKKYQTLLSFVKKYFPSEENINIVNEHKKRFV